MIRTLMLLPCVAVAACSLSPFGSRPDSATSGACEWVAGPGEGTILAGNLVINEGKMVATALYVSGGLIEAIATKDELLKRFPNASVIACRRAVVSPGLINAHEHNAYSYVAPDPNIRPIYAHRDEWFAGLNGKYRLEMPVQSSDKEVLAWVELRHLLSGVTTMAGSGIVAGLVKNVSKPPGSPYEVDLQTFPFKMNAMAVFAPYCAAPPTEWPAVDLTAEMPVLSPYVAHVAEGVSCEAEREIDAYLAHVAAHPQRHYSLIHGISINPSHVRLLTAHDVSVVWSPRSNLALYGKSVDAAWLLDSGVSVALGTDWSLSGSYNLFEEMRCGLTYSRTKSSRPLGGAELWGMVTRNGARALGISNSTGSLEVGKAADIVILDGVGAELRNFGAQSHENVIAVLVDGRVVATDARKLTGVSVDSVCPHVLGNKRLCLDFTRYGFTFEQMRARNHQNVDVVDSRQQMPCRLP